ncbi:MAG: hypothetical protein ACYDA0_14710 [Candidatus Dormibacteraceae bacterium]
MAQLPIEAIEQRDRAMQKLRDLTWACFMWASGLVAVFSVIAAVTLPGQSQSTATTNPGSDSSSGSASVFTNDDGQLQPPADGSFQSGGGSPPLVVSGGSH